MSKRNVYKGHRYVPKIMGEWNQEETYEGLSIVTNKGTSYTSKKRVPVGIDILDEEYWVVTGNYNAQIENYRQEVREFDNRISETETGIEVANTIRSDMNERGVNVKTLGVKADGVTEETSVIQDVLNNHKNVYFPAGLYLIDIEVGLTINNDSVIFFDDNAKIITTNTDKGSYKIIRIENKTNITFPNGLTVVGDSSNHLGTDGEWGHGLVINSSKNIHFYNDVNISDCWGDGVYLGANYLVNNENIHFHGNVNTEDCGRQGISVISAIDSTINVLRAKNIRRTLPSAGLDIEPNNFGEIVDNFKVGTIFVENCRIGVLVYCGNNKINASFGKIVVTKSVDSAFYVTRPAGGFSPFHGDLTVGEIKILESGSDNPIIVQNLSQDGSPSVRIGAVHIDDYTTATEGNAVVRFDVKTVANNQETFGNLVIDIITVKKNNSDAILYPIFLQNETVVGIKIYNLWIGHMQVETGWPLRFFPTISGKINWPSSNFFKMQQSKSLQPVTDVTTQLKMMTPKTIETFEYQSERANNVGLPETGHGVVNLIRPAVGNSIILTISNDNKVYISNYDHSEDQLSAIREL